MYRRIVPCLRREVWHRAVGEFWDILLRWHIRKTFEAWTCSICSKGRNCYCRRDGRVGGRCPTDGTGLFGYGCYAELASVIHTRQVISTRWDPTLRIGKTSRILELLRIYAPISALPQPVCFGYDSPSSRFGRVQWVILVELPEESGG